LARRFPQRRNLAGAGLLLLAIPWQDAVENGMAAALLSSAAIASAVAYGVWRKPAVAVAAAAAMVALAAVQTAVRDAYPPPHRDATAALAAVAQPQRLAEDSWQAYIEATQPHQPLRYTVVRLPTWLGLYALIAAGVLAARTPNAAGKRDPAA
jgi:hypothetical protein